jgi:GWxTD domain-containing protein
MTKRITIIFLLIFGLFSACNKQKELIKALPETDRQFLSVVKYIITKEDRKLFLSLPSDKDRAEFIIKFWKDRDPDLSTEINEFKERHFERIDFANQKFIEGNKEGWRTERGRIYILLGPPDYRAGRSGSIPNGTIVSKLAINRSYLYYPHKVWMYGNFPVIFVDYHQSNTYELYTLSARNLGMINYTLENINPRMKGKNYFFDFRAGIKWIDKRPHLHIRIPMEKMLFNSKIKKGFFVADFTIFITLLRSGKSKIDEISKKFNISLQEKDKKKMSSDFYYDFKLNLKSGKYLADILIKNNDDDYYLRKKIKISL